jgi:hypothetical protein
MSDKERHARRVLEVRAMFEPTRLAADHLADAYAQVVPPRQVPCHRGADLGRTPSAAPTLRRAGS